MEHVCIKLWYCTASVLAHPVTFCSLCLFKSLLLGSCVVTFFSSTLQNSTGAKHAPLFCEKSLPRILCQLHGSLTSPKVLGNAARPPQHRTPRLSTELLDSTGWQMPPQDVGEDMIFMPLEVEKRKQKPVSSFACYAADRSVWIFPAPIGSWWESLVEFGSYPPNWGFQSPPAWHETFSFGIPKKTCICPQSIVTVLFFFIMGGFTYFRWRWLKIFAVWLA